MPRTKRVRTIVEEEIQQKDKNPVPGMVRAYLLEGEEFPDELRELQWSISVKRYDRQGVPVIVKGRVFDELERLPDQLADQFHSGRFKLLVVGVDPADVKKRHVVKIEDYRIEWAGGNAGDNDAEPIEEYEGDRPGALELEILRMRQAHEKELKQMEIQKEMIVAMANAKGGGGVKVSDMLELLQTGIALGSGMPVPQPGQGTTDDPMAALLEHPLAKALIPVIMAKIGTAGNDNPGGAGSAPVPADGQPSGLPQHQRG